jgi:hypothetical protein
MKFAAVITPFSIFVQLVVSARVSQTVEVSPLPSAPSAPSINEKCPGSVNLLDYNRPLEQNRLWFESKLVQGYAFLWEFLKNFNAISNHTEGMEVFTNLRASKKYFPL